MPPRTRRQTHSHRGLLFQRLPQARRYNFAFRLNSSRGNQYAQMRMPPVCCAPLPARRRAEVLTGNVTSGDPTSMCWHRRRSHQSSLAKRARAQRFRDPWPLPCHAFSPPLPWFGQGRTLHTSGRLGTATCAARMPGAESCARTCSTEWVILKSRVAPPLSSDRRQNAAYDIRHSGYWKERQDFAEDRGPVTPRRELREVPQATGHGGPGEKRIPGPPRAAQLVAELLVALGPLEMGKGKAVSRCTGDSGGT